MKSQISLVNLFSYKTQQIKKESFFIFILISLFY